MRRDDAQTSFRPGLSTTRTGLARGALLFALLGIASMAAGAAKEPQLIRQHLLGNPDKAVASVDSIEPFKPEVLDPLLASRIWKVEYREKDQKGESLVFMAVHEGEVLRIYRFDQPRTRENFVKLLREDFRLRSEKDARQVVAATLELYFGFPFSEPEMTAEEMRVVKRNGDYFFIDGERFGDATGYHLTTDDAGRVVGYEYSWELPIEA